jgi:hypothetical protein
LRQTTTEAKTMAGFNLIPAVLIWAVLAIATLALALVRKFVSAGEEDLIRLGPGEERHIPEQVALASRLKAVDRWGKTLTVITMAVGLAVAAVYLYQAFAVHN